MKLIAFAGMLVNAAKQAGIDVPTLIDERNYIVDGFPRWNIFCNLQLGASMPYMGCHWDNAKVIADLTDKELETLTVADILDKGFAVGFANW